MAQFIWYGYDRASGGAWRDLGASGYHYLTSGGVVSSQLPSYLSAFSVSDDGGLAVSSVSAVAWRMDDQLNGGKSTHAWTGYSSLNLTVTDSKYHMISFYSVFPSGTANTLSMRYYVGGTSLQTRVGAPHQACWTRVIYKGSCRIALADQSTGGQPVRIQGILFDEYESSYFANPNSNGGAGHYLGA